MKLKAGDCNASVVICVYKVNFHGCRYWRREKDKVRKNIALLRNWVREITSLLCSDLMKRGAAEGELSPFSFVLLCQ
jgi:hypothetical protein